MEKIFLFTPSIVLWAQTVDKAFVLRLLKFNYSKGYRHHHIMTSNVGATGIKL